MPPLNFVGAAPVVVMAAWLWRLQTSGLSRRYRCFSYFLGWFVLSFLVGTALYFWQGGRESETYLYAWLTINGLRWILWVTVLLEVATLALQPYAGFVEIGQRLIRGSTVAAGFALLGLWTFVPSEWVSNLVSFWQFETYVVYGSLAVIAVLFALATAYFRLIPPRNVRIIFAVVSVTLVGNVLSGVYFGGAMEMFYVNVALHFVVFLVGVTAFSPAAESETVHVQPSRASGEAALSQLELVNETLVRLLKR